MNSIQNNNSNWKCFSISVKLYLNHSKFYIAFFILPFLGSTSHIFNLSQRTVLNGIFRRLATDPMHLKLFSNLF